MVGVKNGCIGTGMRKHRSVVHLLCLLRLRVDVDDLHEVPQLVVGPEELHMEDTCVSCMGDIVQPWAQTMRQQPFMLVVVRTSAARPFSAGDTSSAFMSRPEGYLLSVGRSSNFFFFTTGPACGWDAAALYLLRWLTLSNNVGMVLISLNRRILGDGRDCSQ